MSSTSKRIPALPVLTVAVIALLIGCSTQSPVEPPSTLANQTFDLASEGPKDSFGSVAASVQTGPPAEGVVVEGVNVPGGVALGDTRADVEASYGLPDYVYGDSHRYRIDGQIGHEVLVFYGDGNGGPANNLPSDVVTSVSWSTAVTGWVTTAGVNTTIARDDPEAVIAAYPGAVVSANYNGFISNITAYEQGFTASRTFNFYSGTVSVELGIFNPRPAPPPQPEPEKLTRVYDIDLSVYKSKGKHMVIALVGVRNQVQLAAEGANVVVNWTMPDGSVQSMEQLTSSSGFAYYRIDNARKGGTYVLTVEDVVLEGYRFDSDNSVLTASVTVE